MWSYTKCESMVTTFKESQPQKKKKSLEFWAEYNLWGSVWPTKDLADRQTLKTDLIRDWKATSDLSE